MTGGCKKCKDVYGRNVAAAPRDMVLGLSSGAVFWPMALAHAAVARVPATVAVGTTVLPPVMYVLIGSLPLLSLQSGTTASLCLGELVEQMESAGLTPTDVASLTAAIVGLVHVAMGLLDLGSVAEVFSQPLLRGRVAAAASLVLISQAKTLSGVALSNAGQSPLYKLLMTCAALPKADPTTCVVSLVLFLTSYAVRWSSRWLTSVSAQHAALAQVVCANRDTVPPTTVGEGADNAELTPKLHVRERSTVASQTISDRKLVCYHVLGICAAGLASTANLIVLGLGLLAVHLTGHSSMAVTERIDLSTFGWHMPSANIEQIMAIFLPATLIAFLTFGGHLVVAELIRRPSDTWDPRRELVALGGGSLVAAACGGMPVMANLAVCQTIRNGKGALATIGNAVGHLVAFWFVSWVPTFQKVPLCAVATILVVEFLPLLMVVPREIRHLFQQARLTDQSWRTLLASDFGIYLVAFASPLIFGMIQGSVIAVALELALAMLRFAGAGFTVMGRVPGTQLYDELGAEGSDAVELPQILIVRYSGARWFGNAAATTRIARKQRVASGRDVRCVIADLRMVAFLDETALVHYKREWRKALGYKVLVSNACLHVRRQMDACGLLEILQQTEDTLVDLHAAVSWAEEHICKSAANHEGIGIRAR